MSSVVGFAALPLFNSTFVHVYRLFRTVFDLVFVQIGDGAVQDTETVKRAACDRVA